MDIQEAGFAGGEAGEVEVDFVDDGHQGRVVVARENAGDDDGGLGRLGAHDAQDRLKSEGDVFRRCSAEVVRARLQDDDLWIDAVQLAVFEAPEDVLNPIGAPAEIAGVPAEKVGAPVCDRRKKRPRPGLCKSAGSRSVAAVAVDP